jgi:hypothetical protein
MSRPDDQLWEEVSGALGGRPGWSLQMPSTPGASRFWARGTAGRAGLTVSVDGGALSAYEPESDREHRFASVDELLAWLDGHEAATADAPSLASEVVDEVVHRHHFPWGRRDG